MILEIQYPLLLDGGLSNALASQGCDLNHRLWSASLLEKNPEAIIQAHLAYLKAGAQCLITSSYQASIPGFLEAGYDQESAKKLLLKSIQLAAEAIKRHHHLTSTSDKIWIAVSIGPYGAYLADGSEYRGDYGLTDQELYAFHQARIQILDQTSADFFACETIPSFQEARVLAEILKNTQHPAWVSFSCKDAAHLNDGTPLKKALALFARHPNVFALGVNCTHPKYISDIIPTVRKYAPEKRVIAYPNSGEAYHAETKTWQGISDPDAFAAMASEWISLGVDILGGCCRIGPEHIEKLKDKLS